MCPDKCRWQMWNSDSSMWEVDDSMHFTCEDSPTQKYGDVMIGDQPPEDRLNQQHSENSFCAPGLFACDNLYCIPEHWACDGTNDCEDFSDERNCDKKRQSQKHFQADQPPEDRTQTVEVAFSKTYLIRIMTYMAIVIFNRKNGKETPRMSVKFCAKKPLLPEKDEEPESCSNERASFWTRVLWYKRMLFTIEDGFVWHCKKNPW